MTNFFDRVLSPFTLVSTARVPEATGNPAGMSSAAGELKSKASTITTTSTAVTSAWLGLTEDVYKTPESPAVTAAMPRITDPLKTIKTNLTTAATALDTAATSLTTWRTQRTTLIADINEFLPRANAANAQAQADKAKETEQTSSTGTWLDNPAIVAENNGLWDRLFKLDEALEQIGSDLKGDLTGLEEPGFSFATPSFTPGKLSGNTGRAAATGPGASATAYAGYVWDGKNFKAGYGAQAEAHLFQANAEGMVDNGAWGSGSGGASVNVGARIDVSGMMSVGNDGLHLKQELDVQVGVEGEAHGKYELGIASVEGKAEVMAGAELKTKTTIDVGLNGLNAQTGVNAFAGVKGGLDGGVEVGGVKASGGVDVRAGAGIDANVGVKATLDEVKVSFNFGVALGVGAGVKGDISFSPKELISDVKKLWPF